MACVPPSRMMGSRRRANPNHGSGWTLRRRGDHAAAHSQTLVYNEIIRSDQAIFQPMASLPMKLRRTIGLIVFCQADWISASEYMLFCPNKKSERSGSWWQKNE